MENEIIPSLAVIVASVALVTVQTARLPAVERDLLRLSLIAHLVSAAILLWLMDYVFVESDSHRYIIFGGRISALLRDDFTTWAPEVLKLCFRLDHYLPNHIADGETSTSCMCGFVGVLMFLTGDASFAVQLLLAVLAFYGKWALYRGLFETLPGESFRRPLLLAALFIPSVVLWTSGIVKESLAMVGVGLLVLALSRLFRRITPRALLIGAVGTWLVMAVKPYLLFPFVLGAGAWYFAERTKVSGRAPRPIYLVLAAGAAIGAVAGLGVLFPDFSVERVAESAATQQTLGVGAGGGSVYSLGASRSGGLAGQLIAAPLALVTTLARPFIFEAHNFTALIASAEMTALFALFAMAVRRNTFATIRRRVGNTPVLMFALTFIALGATAIGLGTTNFGTLSRYRVPIMPMYLSLVLLLRLPISAWNTLPQPAIAPTPVRGARPWRGLPGPPVRSGSRRG